MKEFGDSLRNQNHKIELHFVHLQLLPYLECLQTELEKVQIVPSIRNRASSMFLEFLPLLTKSAEEKFTKSVEKIETITKIDTI